MTSPVVARHTECMTAVGIAFPTLGRSTTADAVACPARADEAARPNPIRLCGEDHEALFAGDAKSAGRGGQEQAHQGSGALAMVHDPVEGR